MIQHEKQLSRRERQIMDAVYKLGEASAAEIQEVLPEAPSYSSVRKLLSILEEKALVRHIERDRRYVYLPVLEKLEVRKSALKHVMETFFENSAESIVAPLMDVSSAKMTDEDFRRLTELIEKKKGERK